jgi:cytoskeletal protein CcmA (bactofilin family)/DNA-directed RNA polymerase subunit RPC12/RpoP
MPPKKQAKVQVTCPHCGHRQGEPPTGFSTICKRCGGHFHVQQALKPAPRTVERTLERRQITCFDCGANLDVAVNAESTMCKRCSSHIDLRDYRITNAVSKNFKTKGTFVVEAKAYVFNTEATVGDAVIKGRFLGKLFAERSLTLYSTAEFKGTFNTGRLVIPAENHFRWKEQIRVGSAEIAGELTADLHADGVVVLKSSAKLFGDINAKNLVVEEGGVIVGDLRIGSGGS